MINYKRCFIPPVRLVEPALTGLLVLAGLAVLMTAIQAWAERADVRELRQTYTQLTGTTPSALSVQPSPRDEMIKRMSSHRLVAPPPSFQLTGVLGDAAVFNGSMIVKPGQSAGDMKVITVGPSWVEVQQNGQTQKLYVFQPSMFSASPPPMPRPVPSESRPSVSPTSRQPIPSAPIGKSVSHP